MKRISLYVATIVLAALMSASAAAQVACGRHAEIVGKLESGYQESKKGMGLAANGQLVELFAAEAGNWSILVVTPEGMACLVLTGQDWLAATPPKTASGDMF